MEKRRSFHIEIAQKYWKEFLDKDDIAIDATSGNGLDSLFLAKILAKEGLLYCIDIQKKAIDNTREILKKNLDEKDFKNISIIRSSHENFSKTTKSKVNLIVYNLGYLPLSDKKITTNATSTIASIESALNMLAQKGAISIMSYVGHREGEKEYLALSNFLEKLDKKKYIVLSHKWINKKNFPIFFWVEKIN